MDRGIVMAKDQFDGILINNCHVSTSEDGNYITLQFPFSDREPINLLLERSVAENLANGIHLALEQNPRQKRGLN